MAIVTRYFSTSSAGAADGTTWADRAALFTTGNWSSVITGFAFSGSDSLECRIGPGDYTMSQTLSSAIVTNPPVAGNKLYLHACDSSGNLLDPTDPDWSSAQPVWSQTGIPQITISGNYNCNLANTNYRLLTFIVGSVSHTLPVVTNSSCVDFIYINNASISSSSSGLASVTAATNCCVKMTASYSEAVDAATGSYIKNVRAEGNGSAGSGNRNGVSVRASASHSGITSTNHNGYGIISTAANSSVILISNSTIEGNGSTGIYMSTALTTGRLVLANLYIANNGAYGINLNSSANVSMTQIRLRDNTSGSITGNLNNPITHGVYTTDSDDATEFVDAANGDFRIKASSSIWGKGYGAGDEIPTPAQIATAVWARSGRSLTA